MALDDYTRGVLSKLQLDANNKPFYTPALMAYLRGVGMTLSTAEDTRARDRGQVGRDYIRNVDDAGRNYEQGRKNLTADLVSRGILSSGEANDRFARQDDDRGRQLSQLAEGKANRLTAIDRAYGQVEDSLRQQTVERMLSAEQEEATRKAVAKAQQDQQDQLLKFYQGKK